MKFVTRLGHNETKFPSGHSPFILKLSVVYSNSATAIWMWYILISENETALLINGWSFWPQRLIITLFSQTSDCIHVPSSLRSLQYFSMIILGGPQTNGTVDTVDFSGLCSDQQLSFFTLRDRASFPHYNNTKIIKFGWELFILWVISYGLSFSGFAWFPEFRGMINDSFSRP